MNRSAVMAGAVGGLLLACVMIVAGGRIAQRPEAVQDAVVEAAAPSAAADPQRTHELAASRAVAPAEIAPPPVAPDELERVEPRNPLSKLAQALPPKPKMPDQWEGTLLFQPVAASAGSLTAKGYSIVIAGVDPVAADETCTFEGRSWPCGTSARAAFRAMLRGRAVNCKIPPEADRAAIVVPCRIGKQDIGEWLVANGWARATEKGPYAEAGKTARERRKGVYGPGPVTAAPPTPSAQAAPLATPPVDPPEPSQ